MIKLLLYRLLPIGAAAGIFAGALSPLRATLQTFGAAADALAGEEVVHGGDFEATATLKDEIEAKVKGLGGSKKTKGSKKTLQQLAASLREDEAGDAADPYGEEAGARGLKPIKH